ncbi:MAG: hypothetical protein ACI4RM_01365, partial [Ruminococcus sp.]
KELIEKTVNAHKAICDEYYKKPLTMFQLSGVNIVNSLNNMFSVSDSYYYYYYDYNRLKITYTLNNGTKVNRIYMSQVVNWDKMQTYDIDAVNELTHSKEFICITDKLFIFDENYCKGAEITVYDDKDLGSIDRIKDKEQIAQLIEALRKDILQNENDFTDDYYENGDYVGWVDLYYGNKKSLYSNYDMNVEFYHSFKNTIKVLENLSMLEKAKNI